jgi:hypothetical protein
VEEVSVWRSGKIVYGSCVESVCVFGTGAKLRSVLMWDWSARMMVYVESVCVFGTVAKLRSVLMWDWSARMMVGCCGCTVPRDMLTGCTVLLCMAVLYSLQCCQVSVA